MMNFGDEPINLGSHVAFQSEGRLYLDMEPFLGWSSRIFYTKTFYWITVWKLETIVGNNCKIDFFHKLCYCEWYVCIAKNNFSLENLKQYGWYLTFKSSRELFLMTPGRQGFPLGVGQKNSKSQICAFFTISFDFQNKFNLIITVQ